MRITSAEKPKNEDTPYMNLILSRKEAKDLDFWLGSVYDYCSVRQIKEWRDAVRKYRQRNP